MARRIFSIFFSVLVPTLATAQLSRAYLDYINRYSDWAVEQMNIYRIPASITMAQGLLESRAGQSRLAMLANNHFGIKVGSGWFGPYILEDDDARGEKFRKYASVRDSYEDHSLFLARSKRYSSLFSLAPTDYTGWAYGLKSCGYATSPTYAQSLIRIIETYELYRLDEYGSLNLYTTAPAKHETIIKPNYSEATAKEHGVYMMNQNYYVIVESGDTFEGIARETGVSPNNLRRYNELPKDYVLQEGDILYLQRKRAKGAIEYAGYRHIIKPGESMYTIAQQYGIRLKNLYLLNAKPKDYAAQPGDILWLR